MGVLNKKKILQNNLKIMQERATELHNDFIAFQKEAKKKEEEYKLKIAVLNAEKEDLQGFLKQETEAKEALKKERTQLRKMITQLGGNWKNGK